MCTEGKMDGLRAETEQQQRAQPWSSRSARVGGGGGCVELKWIHSMGGEGISIPTVHVSGTSYEMGFQIGFATRAMIAERLSADPSLHKYLLPFAQTKQGRSIIDRFSMVNRERYPRYWDEMQGIADGSGVSFNLIMLMNFKKEILPSAVKSQEDSATLGSQAHEGGVTSASRSRPEAATPALREAAPPPSLGIQESTDRFHASPHGVGRRPNDVKDTKPRQLTGFEPATSGADGGDRGGAHVEDGGKDRGTGTHQTSPVVTGKCVDQSPASSGIAFGTAIELGMADYRNVGGSNCDDDCSDVLICTQSMALIAHNEDGDAGTKNHTFLLMATTNSGLAFLAYAHAGELPTSAFGVNNRRIAFTMDAVFPADVDLDGIGRNFVSRDLLEAVDLCDAIKRVTIGNLSAGHNYNIADLNRRKIVTVETASKGRFSLKEIDGPDAYFHANSYLRLSIEQTVSPSTKAREARFAALPLPRSVDDILRLLADDEDKSYPIYMQGPTHYTLCTALIDLDRHLLTIYVGKPTIGQKLLEISISEDLLTPFL
ncbi:hypothetical protein CBR_g55541 [Chara braunii]|uniref:Peptidase C45 hydrolase domain-containing protein n=1 Tax=Chara braunii TaxID=69332 RepID=A0A388MD21_CHABU|nr:hypothetical protein CBR_g55541 [Chara braunii]|eukprot:GBG92460.1 hypothetical protein CBR_g55541 [Chara braunii]